MGPKSVFGWASGVGGTYPAPAGPTASTLSCVEAGTTCSRRDVGVTGAKPTDPVATLI